MGDVVWLRRDLRRSDLPTLARAAEAGPVTVLFVVDPALWEPSAHTARRRWLAATLLALRDTYEGRLTLRTGDPATVVPRLAREVGATAVHVSEETEPDGAARDRRVADALGDLPLVRTGSPYAVTPGRVLKPSGDPYLVFTAFSKAWRQHGWRAPAPEPEGLTLDRDRSDDGTWDLVAAAADGEVPALPAAGEEAAAEAWEAFLDSGLDAYAADRDRPDLDATSRLSPYLKLGVVHPRTLLADLAHRPGPGVERFVTELAWREFYADVLHHNPHSEWQDLRPELATMAYDDEPALVDAWRRGRTGVPLVDAGMRQLLQTGWMHNRVRMVAASFLVKHLHTRWQVGAQHFLDHLIDADLASNQHGWQWVAGTGTDAAPYFRVFNPILQGERFDPEATYIRTYLPELSGLTPAEAHRPWTVDAAARGGYPEPAVDLDVERREALARHKAARG
ncbi:MAG TPA: deoxyribodipyrimidine photo-lyase [Propionibacteriaceae bacterium]|nr:deoxyribodipyrimidine photo-lyase [Propionibacteriaceae bacterium]